MDANANRQNDTTIPDDEWLYRGIVRDHIKEGNAISSAAFNYKTDISVDLSSLSSPQETYKRRPTAAGIAQLTCKTARAHTPGVCRDPTETDPAHALIIRNASLSNTKRKEVERALAKASTLIITPGQQSDGLERK